MHLAADLFQRYVFCCDYIFFQVCCEATLRLVQFTCSAGEVRLTCCQVILCFTKGGCRPLNSLLHFFFSFFLVFPLAFLWSLQKCCKLDPCKSLIRVIQSTSKSFLLVMKLFGLSLRGFRPLEPPAKFVLFFLFSN